jgi:hypothetical protein
MEEEDITEYSTFARRVVDRVKEREVEPTRRLIGILFMRRGQEVTEKMIVPSLNYYHERSGPNIDFYLPGWKRTWNGSGLNKPIWEFDEAIFNRSRETIASESSWSYSGGIDLLLFTTRAGQSGEITIDLTGIIVIHVHAMVDKKLVEQPDVLFERIFRFAESFKGSDALVNLSTQEARVSAIEGLINVILGLLPKEGKERLDYARQFVIHDVSKPHRHQADCVVLEHETEEYLAI